MNKKNNKFLSVLTLAGIILIPILNFEYKPNKERIGYEAKIIDELNVHDYRLIPPEMFQNPNGLHYYTTEYNQYLKSLDTNNNDILDEIEKDDNLGGITYYQILIERNFDGWWLFDKNKLIDIESSGNDEVLIFDDYLEEYLQDFFVWSYNIRLDLDVENSTRELNRNDIEIDYEYFGKGYDEIETYVGIGWVSEEEKPNDGSILNNSVYIIFDEKGDQWDGIGDVHFDGIINQSIYYAGILDERMVYPSENQSIDIYKKYTQEQIDNGYSNLFKLVYDDGNGTDNMWKYFTYLEDLIYYILNIDYIKKYHDVLMEDSKNNELWLPRNINEYNEWGYNYVGVYHDEWENYGIRDTNDIRYIDHQWQNNSTEAILSDRPEYKISFYDKDMNRISNPYESNGSTIFSPKYEKFYIKITPIENTYYLDENKTIEYHTSDIIDDIYNSEGNINEYFITINNFEDIGYNGSKPEIPNDNKTNFIFWISLSLIMLIFFLIIIYFFVKKKN